MERRECKKVGRVQVFLDGLCEGNSCCRIASGRQMDREGVIGSEPCERETDVVRVIVGRTVLNLISAYAPQAGRHTGERRILPLIGEDCVGDR